MERCGKPWSQLSNKEKIESLHKAQEQNRRALNKLYCLIMQIGGKTNRFCRSDNDNSKRKNIQSSLG